MKNNAKIAVLGFGREGRAVLNFLKQFSKFKNAKIAILDKKKDKNYLQNLNDFDVVFRSPGVPYNLPKIQRAIKNGVKFSSATDLFFQNAKGKIIGVTGTKGKSTVSTLIYKILKAAKKDVYLAGNIGKPAIKILPKLNKNSISVLELSSFQLQGLKHSPSIAIILDVFEDHMDTHKNFKEYINAKANIAVHQKPKDKIFYFINNKYSKLISHRSSAKKIPVNTKDCALLGKNDLKISGAHNFKNAAMASMVAKNLSAKQNIIKNTIKNFRGLEHRLEFVKQIKAGCPEKIIVFYNDSASTNPLTTVAAIKSFREPKILIAGGKDKNLNFKPLSFAIKKSNTRLVILFGENKNKIYRQLKHESIKLEIKKCSDIKTAVKLANNKAVSAKEDKIIVLFSPASASFDMFKNYQERGGEFKKIVADIEARNLTIQDI